MFIDRGMADASSSSVRTDTYRSLSRPTSAIAPQFGGWTVWVKNLCLTGHPWAVVDPSGEDPFVPNCSQRPLMEWPRLFQKQGGFGEYRNSVEIARQRHWHHTHAI